jgi:hypothetical protein
MLKDGCQLKVSSKKEIKEEKNKAKHLASEGKLLKYVPDHFLN